MLYMYNFDCSMYATALSLCKPVCNTCNILKYWQYDLGCFRGRQVNSFPFQIFPNTGITSLSITIGALNLKFLKNFLEFFPVIVNASVYNYRDNMKIKIPSWDQIRNARHRDLKDCFSEIPLVQKRSNCVHPFYLN